MARDASTPRGIGSLQNPLFALGSLNVPLEMTGPTMEVDLGMLFKTREGVPASKQIQYEAVVSLGQAPSDSVSVVTCEQGTAPGTVLVKAWRIFGPSAGAYASNAVLQYAAAGAAVKTKFHLIAIRGASGTK
jgi:hypothetical protein